MKHAKKFKPMGLTIAKPFDSDNYIFEFKFDGMRAIAYISESTTILISKHGKDITEMYPELKDLYKFVSAPCVLDGEIVATQNGKPSFSKLQQRIHMSNLSRIESASKKHPVQFIAFDILSLNDNGIAMLPLTERKKVLSENIQQSYQIIISQYIERDGNRLFEIAKAQGLEGIVAKRKHSQYKEGIKNQDWLKIKISQDKDFIITDYKLSEVTGKVGSLYFKDLGWHNFNLNRFTSDEIIRHFEKQKGKLTCTVEYLEKTENGSMRMPVFKGIRLD